MQNHFYDFGSAVGLKSIATDHPSVRTNNIINLNGVGFGFNSVTTSNSLKWHLWESPEWWSATNSEASTDIQWLINNNIRVRGHNLIWGACGYLPEDICDNSGNSSYVLNRMQNHFNTIMNYSGIAGNIYEWDVINEPAHVRYLFNEFEANGYGGYNLYNWIYNTVKNIDPNPKLYINDYGILSSSGLGVFVNDRYKSIISTLLSMNTPIDGIGLQAHFGAWPQSIPRMKNVLDDYASFGLDIKITEYDFVGYYDLSMEANFLSDLMTLAFGHPSTTGFIIWGFGPYHWRGDSPIYTVDENGVYTLDPSGQAYIDLVFDEWWTNETTPTDIYGYSTVRAFKGKHNVSVEYNGVIYDGGSIELTNDTTISVSLNIAVSPVNCPDSIHISSPYSGNYIFSADSYISATNDLNINNNIAYNAGDHISLQPGFNAEAEAVGAFSASIQNCVAQSIIKPKKIKPVNNK